MVINYVKYLNLRQYQSKGLLLKKNFKSIKNCFAAIHSWGVKKDDLVNYNKFKN